MWSCLYYLPVPQTSEQTFYWPNWKDQTPCCSVPLLFVKCNAITMGNKAWMANFREKTTTFHQTLLSVSYLDMFNLLNVCLWVVSNNSWNCNISIEKNLIHSPFILSALICVTATTFYSLGFVFIVFFLLIIFST